MESRANPIVFITWLWSGWNDIYSERHVAALRNMLAEHAPDHRLVVVSDKPVEVKDVIYYPLWENPLPHPPGLKQNCFPRLKLFDPDFGFRFGDRLVSIDLDVLIQKDMAPLFEEECPFRAIRGESAVFNGTMWELAAGRYPEVWQDFVSDPEKAMLELNLAVDMGGRYRGSDQGWMSLLLEGVGQFWDENDGVLHWSQEKYADRRHRLDDARMICFAGGIKPWQSECKRITPNVYRRYMEYFNA